MFFKVFSFGCLEIEPRVGKVFDVWQKGLDERMIFVLKMIGNDGVQLGRVSSEDKNAFLPVERIYSVNTYS